MGHKYVCREGRYYIIGRVDGLDILDGLDGLDVLGGLDGLGILDVLGGLDGLGILDVLDVLDVLGCSRWYSKSPASCDGFACLRKKQ